MPSLNPWTPARQPGRSILRKSARTGWCANTDSGTGRYEESRVVGAYGQELVANLPGLADPAVAEVLPAGRVDAAELGE